MTDLQSMPGRSRLSDRTERSIAPFVRAHNVSTISLYWMPVARFPIEFRQREWILEFLERLGAHFKKLALLEEVFLGLKYTRQELNRRFTQTLLDYEPITGVVLTPGQGLPATPTSMDIKKIVDNPDSNAEVRIEHLVPDYTAWFLQKKSKEQKQDFFGVGGMSLFWVEPDPNGVPSTIPISKGLATHPAFKGHDLDAMMRKLQSMQAPWLKRSKEVFGDGLKQEGMYQGLPFIAPKLAAADFTAASPHVLEAWFQVFKACVLESEQDGGILFAVVDPEFDGPLQDILESMVNEGMRYPL